MSSAAAGLDLCDKRLEGKAGASETSLTTDEISFEEEDDTVVRTHREAGRKRRRYCRRPRRNCQVA